MKRKHTLLKKPIKLVKKVAESITNPMDEVIAALLSLMNHEEESIVVVKEGSISFQEDIVEWFKQKSLKKDQHIPFVANAKTAEFKKMLQWEPSKKIGLFIGVYDEKEDAIIQYKLIDADELDSETDRVLDKEKLVVLN